MAIKLSECVGSLFEKEVDPAVAGSTWLDPRNPELGYTGWYYYIKHNDTLIVEAGPFRTKEEAAAALDSYKQFLFDTKQIEE